MNEPTPYGLTQRLDRLERENHRLKLAGAVAVLALIAVGAMGQMIPRAVSKVVEAERFVLRDTGGKMVGAFGTVASGAAGLSLYDQNGKPRAVLAVRTDGSPGLSLADQNGKDRLLLDVGADGAPRLTLLDRNEKMRAYLAGWADGASGLGLADQNGKSRAALMGHADGTSGLVLTDQNGEVRVLLDLDTRGPSLVLQDENSKTRTVLGHTDLVKTATGTVEQRPASSLVLFDKDGKVIWKAP